MKKIDFIDSPAMYDIITKGTAGSTPVKMPADMKTAFQKAAKEAARAYNEVINEFNTEAAKNAQKVEDVQSLMRHILYFCKTNYPELIDLDESKRIMNDGLSDDEVHEIIEILDSLVSEAKPAGPVAEKDALAEFLRANGLK